nr:glutamate cyclase domain-containing protein [uncultured Dethiosulfovibrio sp.]
MKDICESLISLVASDRPGRGPSRLCRWDMLSRALELLSGASKVGVVTGFFIPSAGVPETDGPGGAVALARALALWGKEVSLWTDRSCLSVVQGASSAIGGPPVSVAGSGSEVLDWGPDLLVYIERLGRAEDGEYYNMRGQAITSTVVPLDEGLLLASHKGIKSISIGDGGNEAGMGKLFEGLSRILPGYGSCLSVVSSDVAIPVDVSDWGGYALAGLLSMESGLWCGVSGEEIRAMIEAEVAEGAVDGVTLQGSPSVDGFSLEDQMAIGEDIRRLTAPV